MVLTALLPRVLIWSYIIPLPVIHFNPLLQVQFPFPSTLHTHLECTIYNITSFLGYCQNCSNSDIVLENRHRCSLPAISLPLKYVQLVQTMAPFLKYGSLTHRAYDDSPATSLNIPVIALVLAFTLLLLVCFSMCCCSYRRTTSRNYRYERQRRSADRDWVGFTPLASPSIREISGATKAKKEASLSQDGGPPAYSTSNLAVPTSPQFGHYESERLLPPTPGLPAPPSPPPPTYDALR